MHTQEHMQPSLQSMYYMYYMLRAVSNSLMRMRYSHGRHRIRTPMHKMHTIGNL